MPMEATKAVEETPFRAVDDVGVRVPPALPLPIDPEIEAVVKRLAGITRGAGIVLAAREIAADPSSTLRTVLALMKLLVFGRAQQTIDEVVGAAPKLGCKEGCAWCCYQSVEATIPEAILIAAQIGGDEDPRRAKFLANAERLRGKSELERRRTGGPCPLLVDNRCSAYDDRPLMCRGLMATEADACRRAHEAALAGRADATIEAFVYAQYFVLGDQAGLRGILRDMGLQDDVVELTQAVAAILRDPTIIDRWLARERAFGPETMCPAGSGAAA
jgi:Fe-S-cluster containining protein